MKIIEAMKRRFDTFFEETANAIDAGAWGMVARHILIFILVVGGCAFAVLLILLVLWKLLSGLLGKVLFSLVGLPLIVYILYLSFLANRADSDQEKQRMDERNHLEAWAEDVYIWVRDAVFFVLRAVSEYTVSSEENRNYVQKSGKWADDSKSDTSVPSTFEEWGELPQERPGTRSDLAVLYELIKDGLSNFEIMEQNPDYILNLEKIERARQAVREQQYRDTFRQLEVTYTWGPTGTGKTRGVMERHSYSGVYRVTDYAHPFDSYAGEEVLLLDEYNSNFKIRDLLNYLDGYPLSLPARYSNRVACYTKVYLISNLCLTKQYPDVQFESPATFAALLRRIHKVVRYTGPGQFAEYDTAEYMENPFLNGCGRW